MSCAQIVIEGCSHGSLDQIYASVLALDQRDDRRTDLVILCGDVQTLRNRADLHCLAVPDKYKQLGDFHRYYADGIRAPSGDDKYGINGDATSQKEWDEEQRRRRVAPYLTVMIGGNHEASNYLWELCVERVCLSWRIGGGESID